MHCVDLGESFQTHIYLQILGSIQPRTNPVKFARSPFADRFGDFRRLRHFSSCETLSEFVFIVINIFNRFPRWMKFGEHLQKFKEEQAEKKVVQKRETKDDLNADEQLVPTFGLTLG